MQNKYSLTFSGTAKELFALVTKSIFMTCVTLGFFNPWARTEFRRFYYQNLEILGHRLRYHGTAKELMRGYLIVLGVYIFSFFPLKIATTFSYGFGSYVIYIYGTLVVLSWPLITIASSRYQLSRTSYRGIYFSMHQISKKYALWYYAGIPLTLLSASFFYPIWQNILFSIRINATSWGSAKFSYSGTNKNAFYIYLKYFFVIVFSFGIGYFWYQAARDRFRAENSNLNELKLNYKIVGTEYLLMFLLKIITLPYTLGLAYPWLKIYKIRFVLRKLQLTGQIEYIQITNQHSTASAAGDAWSNIMDISVGI
jgi:uncharacterized membrane protein YjgN (DUF898 family)